MLHDAPLDSYGYWNETRMSATVFVYAGITMETAWALVLEEELYSQLRS